MADFWKTIFGRSDKSAAITAESSQRTREVGDLVNKAQKRADDLIKQLERAKVKGKTNAS